MESQLTKHILPRFGSLPLDAVDETVVQEFVADLKRAARSPIYDGALLVPGNRVVGPAVIETTDTTVVVHPSRSLKVDAFGNFEIHF